MTIMGRVRIIILFLMIGQGALAQGNGAVCDVELKGTEYSLHLVEIGENLFRIAQKYNSSVEAIWEANPSIVDNTIIPGQVIKVPRGNAEPGSVAGDAGIQQDADRPTYAAELDSSQFVYHEVGTGQTLFSISRLYSVTVSELQQWNDLTDYNLSVGQRLIVSAHGEIRVMEPETETVTSYRPSSGPIRRAVSVNSRQDVLYQRYLTDESDGMTETKERGAAEKLVTNNPEMQDVYYALHKTAPIGSVMKVMNLVNRKYVFVTVLAPLPDITENENVQVKLSPAATKELVMLDGKSLVEISYHQP